MSSFKIYLNHAGTTWPKPDVVHEAAGRALRARPDENEEILAHAQRDVAAFFGLSDPDRVLFPGGCTSALALAIHGLPWNAGDGVITSHHEHHALARPVRELERDRDVRHFVAPVSETGPIDLGFVEDVLRRESVRLVACTMASNVTGEILPAADLVRLAHRHGALCLLDGAQTAGVLPVNVSELAADVFVFAGHKGPLAPLGVGGLYLAPEVDLACPSAACSISRDARAERFLSYCDAGSANLPAIAGLSAGIGWLRSHDPGAVGRRARVLAARLHAGVAEIPGIRLHGPADPDLRTAVVCLTHRRKSPEEIDSLCRARGVVGRAGHHCAPLAHEAIGTASTGTFRLSCGATQTEDDVDRAIAVLRELGPA